MGASLGVGHRWRELAIAKCLDPQQNVGASWTQRTGFLLKLGHCPQCGPLLLGASVSSTVSEEAWNSVGLQASFLHLALCHPS